MPTLRVGRGQHARAAGRGRSFVKGTPPGAASLAYQATTNGTFSAASSFAVTLPTFAVNDYALLVCSQAVGWNLAATGWSELKREFSTNDDCTVTIFGRVLESGDTGPTVTITGGTDSGRWDVITIRNSLGEIAALDGTANAAKTASGSSHAVTSGVVNNAGSLMVSGVIIDVVTASSGNWTPPTGFTERVDAWAMPGTSRAPVGIATKQSGAVSASTLTWTWGGAETDEGVAWSLVLKPAVVTSGGGGSVVWSSSFEASPYYSEWDGTNPTTDAPTMWPQTDPIAAVTGGGSYPAADDGTKIMRFPMDATDAAAGRIHSKLYKTFAIGTGADPAGRPNLNLDVSGRHFARIYWPSARRLSNHTSSFETTGLIGWKELYWTGGSQGSGSYTQDSTWWINLLPRQAVVGWGVSLNWIRPDPGAGEPDYPCAYIRHWNNGVLLLPSDLVTMGGGNINMFPIPVGQWFDCYGDVYDEAVYGASGRIDFVIDGTALDTGMATSYTVGSNRTGRGHGEHRLIWEIGNYGSANTRGVTYFDKNSITRHA